MQMLDLYLKYGNVGYTLTLINSLIRSTMKICSLPEGALRITASSPVRIHLPLPSVSSKKVSLLALGLLRYPKTTEGDWTTSSPG
jgi:hypothetical protein